MSSNGNSLVMVQLMVGAGVSLFIPLCLQLVSYINNIANEYYIA